ncbi:hypothetical protein ACFV06_12040 [Streptomyces sp. NPDC059618]|uniref:hypothetical protein n=1 Tax=Streptomyces sp. NPDC059618 TaxID=3346887 RepID=UPI00367654E8
MSPNGNTSITSVDWNTGTVTEQKLSKAGYTLFCREPEGTVFQIPNRNNPQALRL